MQLLTDDETAGLVEIQRLLDEAYAHYFANSDGHCKSEEGYVELQLNNVFERREDNVGLQVTGVCIYSYVLGPGRSHYFDSVSDALGAVKGWHKDEMQNTYEDWSGEQ